MYDEFFVDFEVWFKDMVDMDAWSDDDEDE